MLATVVDFGSPSRQLASTPPSRLWLTAMAAMRALQNRPLADCFDLGHIRAHMQQVAGEWNAQQTQ